jgi:uncharacterized protein YndB with AHSA1/START domain
MSSTHSMKLSTPSDRELVVTRIFDAPRELVFDAWTNPKYIPQWLLGPEGWTMPVCEVDLREGGAWHFVWRKSDGAEMEMRGTYREIRPPERLVSIESWGGDWPETVNTLVLTEEGGQTTATMTILYPSKEAREAAMQTGMTKGMEMTFDRLEKYLQSMDTLGTSNAGRQP